jgi:hypothetical protein
VVSIRYGFYGHNCSPRGKSRGRKFTTKSTLPLSKEGYGGRPAALRRTG